MAFDPSVGIAERRAREREQRRADIVTAAWAVAERDGWATFSVERVAAHAELGRATVYGYFESLEALVLALAQDAFTDLSERVAAAAGLPEALDVPVRLSQHRPAAFSLLYPSQHDPRPAFSNDELDAVRVEARQIIGRLSRLAKKSPSALPDDAPSAEAFLAAIGMAATVVPELSKSTTLRRRWQDFALREAGIAGEGADSDSDEPGDDR